MHRPRRVDGLDAMSTAYQQDNRFMGPGRCGGPSRSRPESEIRTRGDRGPAPRPPRPARKPFDQTLLDHAPGRIPPVIKQSGHEGRSECLTGAVGVARRMIARERRDVKTRGLAVRCGEPDLAARSSIGHDDDRDKPGDLLRILHRLPFAAIAAQDIDRGGEGSPPGNRRRSCSASSGRRNAARPRVRTTTAPPGCSVGRPRREGRTASESLGASICGVSRM